MNKRFLDIKRQSDLLSDFVRRKHGMPIYWLLSGFVFVVVALFVVTAILAPQALWGIGGTAFALLTGLAVLSFLYLHNSSDIVMATEFQNALFAATMRANTEFCLILKRDGTVVYSDLQNNPTFAPLLKKGLNGLDALLTHDGLTRRDKDTLLKSLKEKKAARVPFLYHKLGGVDEKLLLLVEPVANLRTIELFINPIERPEGYITIRAVKPLARGDILRTPLEDIPAAVFVLDDNQIITYRNHNFLQWTGGEVEDMFVNPLHVSDVIRFSGEIPYHGRATLIGARGNRDVLLSIQEVDTGMGRREYYGIMLQDTAAPMAKPMALSGNISDAWELFIEHSPIAIAYMDVSGKVVKDNAAFRKITEYGSMASAEGNFLDVLAQGKEEIQQLLGRTSNLSSFEEKPIDIKIAGSQGSTALLYVWCLEGVDGNAPGVLVHLIDTTEQKNLELRFAHSQKMQAVGQLAGGIAHDFNNLLTAMMGFCDLLLLRHPAGDPSFADIMQIKQNANRAANLVRQLLAFSRKQTLQPEVLDITDVLAELSNLIRRLIGENIELKIDHGRDLGLIRVDQGQLEQVLINLAVNARDAMPEGGALTIQTNNVIVDKKHPIAKDLIPAEDEVIEDGEYVLVEVIDSGHGIPKEVLRKIFEPFFSTKEMGSGTGLGLSTVYGIIKQTGGYVFVTSKVGQGTKFSIFLKSYRQEVAAIQKKEEDTTEKSIPRDLTGKETILLVEDEVPVRIFSAKALTNKGYTVLEAESGEAALKVVAERGKDIDVIITDVIMPGMNGPTMVEEVAKHYPGIKVVFISGYAEDAFVKTYGTERKFNFLPKPFTLKQLASKVKEVVEKEDA